MLRGVQPEPLLAWLGAVFSCPVPCFLGAEPGPHLDGFGFAVDVMLYIAERESASHLCVWPVCRRQREDEGLAFPLALSALIKLTVRWRCGLAKEGNASGLALNHSQVRCQAENVTALQSTVSGQKDLSGLPFPSTNS